MQVLATLIDETHRSARALTEEPLRRMPFAAESPRGAVGHTRVPHRLEAPALP